MSILQDKNGTNLEIGAQIKDQSGMTGTIEEVSGVNMVKFEHKGKTHYTVLSKIIPAQIEKVVVA